VKKNRLLKKTSQIDAFKKKNEYFWGIVYHYHFWEL